MCLCLSFCLLNSTVFLHRFFFFALVNTSNSTAFSMPLVNEVFLAEAFPNSTKRCTKRHEIQSCQSSLGSTFEVSRVKLVKVLRELLYPDHTKTSTFKALCSVLAANRARDLHDLPQNQHRAAGWGVDHHTTLANRANKIKRSSKTHSQRIVAALLNAHSATHLRPATPLDDK